MPIAEAEAMSDDPALLAGYPEDWYVSWGWPSEYPEGISVLDANVTVPGRAKPNPQAPKNLNCTLPQYASYQLWNSARTQADKIEYIVATKIQTVTLNADAEIPHDGTAPNDKLRVKAGDQFAFLRYMQEGWALYRFDGEEYMINQGDLESISDAFEAETETDQWVRVTCTDGTQAWLLHAETIALPGLAPTPITGYGESADLRPDEIEAIRADLALRAAEEAAAATESP